MKIDHCWYFDVFAEDEIETSTHTTMMLLLLIVGLPTLLSY